MLFVSRGKITLSWSSRNFDAGKGRKEVGENQVQGFRESLEECELYDRNELVIGHSERTQEEIETHLNNEEARQYRRDNRR